MEGAGMRESTSGNQVNGSTPQRLQEATKLRASPPSCRRCRCRRMSDCLGQCDIAVGPFRGAVVNLQLAVFQEARQRFPLIQRVAYRGPDGLFSRTSACRYRWNLPISRDTLAGWKPALLDGGTVRSCKAGLWPAGFGSTGKMAKLQEAGSARLCRPEAYTTTNASGRLEARLTGWGD